MNEKLSFQHVADALSQKAGVSKKVADTFVKAFFDTIVEALYMGEESIRVKGLGTFKLVSVGSRESVNVSNGERIVIAGYRKVAFSPEDSVVDFLNQQVDEQVEEASLVEEVAVEVPVPPVSESAAPESVVPVEVAVTEESSEATVPVASLALEEMVAVPEPEKVEIPQDDFAGIDLLISTPESVEEVRLQYEQAKVKMEEAVEEARKANAEKLRLEKLLARLEANVVPEATDSVEEAPVVADEPTPVDASTSSDSAPSEDAMPSATTPSEERRRQALERYMNDAAASPAKEEEKESSRKHHKRKARVSWVVILVVLLWAVIAFFLYKTFCTIESVENVEVVKPSAVKRPSATPKTMKPAGKKPQAENKDAHPTVDKSAQPVKQEMQPAKQEVQSVKQEVQPVKSEVQPATTEPKSAPKAAQPSRPATYVLQKGESLTRISQRFYGTKDSVRAIIRANQFANPDNVPVGAVIKLPK